ncbi:MAG: tetratricopeptide repeat protein, partial [Pseudomonadota bacterium]
FLLIILSYSNTFNSSWHLDDYNNIVNNRIIRINDLSTDSAVGVLATKGDGLRFRPVSMFSFAINWYFGKDNVFGYHIVNTCIHILTSFFLFLTIFSLFNTPNLKSKLSEEDKYFISLLSAILWAINPIQIQAVTYIVQRMTSMAALFYIIGLFLYIKARLFSSLYKKATLFICILPAFIFAIYSKENTITLPLALILIEILFFQDLAKPEKRKKLLIASGIATIIIIFLGIFLFLGKDLLNILRSYENRYFTPYERLLTEARILVYYISLIFYPAPTRLSIEHDIDISTSIFHPWTTMPSIIFIIILIGIGIWQARKRPFLSFAILFFFLNHIIESTIIGLELIFEHRNYLPSFFIFIPVCLGLKKLIDNYQTNKFMRFIICLFIACLITGFGISTYVGNIKWTSEVTLLTDAMNKAPQSARAATNFSKAYYESTEQYSEAIELYHKALYLKTHNRYYKGFILNNIAGIYYHLGDLKRAEKFWEKASEVNPVYKFPFYGLALVSFKNNKLYKGLYYLNKTGPKNKNHKDVLNLKGIILYKQGNHIEALKYFRKSLIFNKNDDNVLTNIGAVYCLMGEYKKAELFLKEAVKRNPIDEISLTWLIEMALRFENNIAADRYIDSLFSSMETNELMFFINKLNRNAVTKDAVMTPHYQKLVAKKVYDRIKLKTDKMIVP